MVDEGGLGPGFPEWTELGQETGLDPLGMQRPIEVVYQSLLPGISTVTVRLRYYSFFPWLLDAYARRNGSTDITSFRAFQRRAEALLALISARDQEEHGATGIRWARRLLHEERDQSWPDGTIDLAAAADLDGKPTSKYVDNKLGAFGAIYASQLREMNLVRLDDPEVLVPCCTNAAIPLAEAMWAEFGDLADLFLKAVETGRVTTDTIDRLSPMKPSQIRSGGAEQEALAAVLTGRQANASGSDKMRRRTLIELLRLGHRLERAPRADDAKWAWFEIDAQYETRDSDDVLPLWSLYQASDLTRLAYEGLLSVGLRTLRTAPFSRQTLRELVADMIDAAEIEGTGSLAGYLETQAEGGQPGAIAQRALFDLLEAERTGDIQGEMRAAFSLLAALWNKRIDYPQAILRRLRAADHFQSYATEIRFLESWLHRPARSTFEEIIATRVIKRHLWVASRKFRNQRAYTFLLEPDDGQLRYRDHFTVSPSSPRIDQAVQFLRDARLLDDHGPTGLGRSEIDRQ